MLATRRLGVGLAMAVCIAGSPALSSSPALAGSTALAGSPALAGSTTLAGSPALSSSPALAGSTALAAISASGPVAGPAATFHTWRAAQDAARFRLLSPRRTYKLKHLGAIHVEPCPVTGETRKRIVNAAYGKPGHALLGIEQNNSGGSCGEGEVAKSLGQVTIHGVTAHLAGLCGTTGLPSCHSKKIFLFLTWKHRGIYYQAISDNEARSALIGFARALHRLS